MLMLSSRSNLSENIEKFLDHAANIVCVFSVLLTLQASVIFVFNKQTKPI